MRKLFVSYARENKADVDQLVAHLGTMGYDTWVDAALRGGQDWWDEILRRIADTDVVIAIYSAAALNSTACAREFEWAQALGKPVVPVAIEPPPTALPSRFARRQIIDYSEPTQRAFAALQLQGALATLPPTPPLPDPLPEPPAAPLSYLTDLIDLITQSNALDHDQQHQILHQVEPALTSFDPLERRGGRDILERFSTRRDLYADVDRTITRLRQLPGQPARVEGREPSTQNTAVTAEQAEVSDAGEPSGATTASPLSSPASMSEPELTRRGEPALGGDHVDLDLAGTSAPGADADMREATADSPMAGSNAEAAVHLADQPAPAFKAFALKGGMADVAVVTDSTACLPGALVDSLGITVVSLYYDVGGGWLRESEFDGDFAQFYGALDASKSVATTTAPSVEDFVVVFERLLQHHSMVVAVLISSGLSETCSIAREAAARLESEGRGGERVVVIDSAGAGGHLGVQALAAARAAAVGADLDGVIERVRQARQEVRQWILLDTLEYLRRGGRIGTAAAWIGSALDLKPILIIESEFRAVERVRTRRRAVERLVELMRQRRAVGADRWFVQHAYAHEDAKRLAERLAQLFGTKPEFISELGPVVATHVGPGALVAGGLPGAALG